LKNSAAIESSENGVFEEDDESPVDSKNIE
jgi:hypothetical protein